jgi:DNA-binding Xre family transcriptional regulator
MIMPIKFRLKELMQERGLTFKQVSEGARVSTNTLYTLRENEQKQVGVEVIGRLLDFFDCQPNDLIIRTKE